MTMLDERSALQEGGAHLASPVVTFECHGAVVRVRSDDPATLAALRERLPPGARAHRGTLADAAYRIRRVPRSADGAPEYVVAVRDRGAAEREEIARTDALDDALELLAGDVEFRVALHAPERLFVHAAAVAWEGRAIVLPGPTFSGKSTLTVALLRAGASYLSDEFTVLAEDGLVHPFARPLHLRALDGLSAHDVHPERLGVVGTTPLPLGLVAATTFRAGARWRPRPMTPGRTALVLLDNAVVARTRPTHALSRIARALADGAPGLRGVRGEADEAARWLLDLAGRAFAGSLVP